MNNITCQNCKNKVPDVLHSCPYQEEIHDNTDTKNCNCCDDCMHECLMDI